MYRVSKLDRPADRPLHIVLYGLFGFGNTGNDATLEVTLDILRRISPQPRFTVVAQEPAAVEASFGVEATAIKPAVSAKLPRPISAFQKENARWAHARALLRSADCLMIPGTGILDDFGCSVMQHPYQIWKWCTVARMAGVPVKFVSIGAGPVEQPWSRRFFRWAASMADHRSYRDEASKKFAAEELGLDTRNDVVTPDLVFGLDVPVPPDGDNQVRTVGIGVMEYHTWQGGAGGKDDIYPSYMAKLADFCVDLLARGFALRLLVGEPSDETALIDLHNRLTSRVPQLAHSIAAPRIRTLRDLCIEIGKTDLVVATRYHNIVGAMICGRPAISIGYAPKHKAVMAEFGLGEYCQDIRDFDPAILRRHFDSLLENYRAKTAGMQVVGARLKAQVQRHLADVVSKIAVS